MVAAPVRFNFVQCSSPFDFDQKVIRSPLEFSSVENGDKPKGLLGCRLSIFARRLNRIDVEKRDGQVLVDGFGEGLCGDIVGALPAGGGALGQVGFGVQNSGDGEAQLLVYPNNALEGFLFGRGVGPRERAR